MSNILFFSNLSNGGIDEDRAPAKQSAGFEDLVVSYIVIIALF